MDDPSRSGQDLEGFFGPYLNLLKSQNLLNKVLGTFQGKERCLTLNFLISHLLLVRKIVHD